MNISSTPDQIEWYIIALAIIALTALLSFGIGKSFSRWEEEMDWPKWLSILGEVLGIITAAASGATIGYLMWDWKLGMVCGMAGGWGSPYIITWVHKYISKKTGSVSKASVDPKSENFGNITLLSGMKKKNKEEE